MNSLFPAYPEANASGPVFSLFLLRFHFNFYVQISQPDPSVKIMHKHTVFTSHLYLSHNLSDAGGGGSSRSSSSSSSNVAAIVAEFG